jgi:hypothetical protein
MIGGGRSGSAAGPAAFPAEGAGLDPGYALCRNTGLRQVDPMDHPRELSREASVGRRLHEYVRLPHREAPNARKPRRARARRGIGSVARLGYSFSTTSRTASIALPTPLRI